MRTIINKVINIHKLPPTTAYTHNAAQCVGCHYWRSLSGLLNGDKGCHKLLDTGERRVQLDGGCGSYKRRHK